MRQGPSNLSYFRKKDSCIFCDRILLEMPLPKGFDFDNTKLNCTIFEGTCTEYFSTIELWVTTFGPNNQENSSDESVFNQKPPAAFPPILALQRKKNASKACKINKRAKFTNI